MFSRLPLPLVLLTLAGWSPAPADTLQLSTTEIAEGVNGFAPTLPLVDFGSDGVSIGDVDGNGVEDLAITDPAGETHGVIWILMLDADQQVIASTPIVANAPGSPWVLPGPALLQVAAIGDWNGDAIPDLGVWDSRRELWLLSLETDGSLQDATQVPDLPFEITSSDFLASTSLRTNPEVTLAFSESRRNLHILTLDSSGAIGALVSYDRNDFSGGPASTSFGEVTTIDDLDGDGWRDLAFVVRGAIGVARLGPNGVLVGETFTFEDAIPGNDVDDMDSRLTAVGDVDGNGISDLVLRSDIFDDAPELLALFVQSDGSIRSSLWLPEAGLPTPLPTFYGARCNTDRPELYLPDGANSVAVVDLSCGLRDRNGNGVPDGCDLDCNLNGIPDLCDIDPNDPDGDRIVFDDCDGNLLLDACEIDTLDPDRNQRLMEDCNGNGVPDSCDIEDGVSLDENGDGIPDECSTALWRRIDGVFGQVTVSPENKQQFGFDLASLGDVNGDGVGDLAVVARGGRTTAPGRLHILLLRPDGTLLRENLYEPNNREIRALRNVGDLDGDGLPELVISVDLFAPPEEDEFVGLELVRLTAAGDIAAVQPIDLSPWEDALDASIGYTLSIWRALDESGTVQLLMGDRTNLHRLTIDATGSASELESFVGLPEPLADLAFTAEVIDDLDGDGTPEFVLGFRELRVVFAGPDLMIDRIVDVGDGLATTGGPLTVPFPRSIQDVDGDGRRELVVTREPGLSVLQLGDDGRIIGERLIRAPDTLRPLGFRQPHATIDLGDFNGDGLRDYAVGDLGSGFGRSGGLWLFSQLCGDNSCLANGIGDACQPDCNDNGVPDACEIRDGLIADCNANGIPDVCEVAGQLDADCNANGVLDSCELLNGSAEDTLPPGGDGIPDVCQTDCDGNQQPDAADLDAGRAGDCDNDGLLDSCAIRDGLASDNDLDGVPDACIIRQQRRIDVSAAARGLQPAQLAGLGDLYGDGGPDLLVHDGFQLVHLNLLPSGKLVDVVDLSDVLRGFGDTTLFLGEMANLGVRQGVQRFALGVGAFRGGAFQDEIWILDLAADGSLRQVAVLDLFELGLTDRLETRAYQQLATLGDLNGDGADDLAIGARNNGGDNGPGAVIVLLLNPDGSIRRSRTLSGDNGLFPVPGVANLGARLSAAGDVNGDRIPDLRTKDWLLLLRRNGAVREVRQVKDWTQAIGVDADRDGKADVFGLFDGTLSSDLLTVRGGTSDTHRLHVLPDGAPLPTVFNPVRVTMWDPTTQRVAILGVNADFIQRDIYLFAIEFPPCPRDAAGSDGPDRNHNGVADRCDIASGIETDCNLDGVIDAAQGRPYIAGHHLDFSRNRLQVPSDDGLVFVQGDEITIEALVRPTAVSSTYTILAKNRAGRQNYFLQVRDGHLDFGYANEGETLILHASDAPIIDVNRWQHVAVTHRFGTEETTLYHDGRAVAGRWNRAPTVAPNGARAALRIATTLSASGPGNTSPFEGQMDELRIYRSIRAGADIAADRQRSVALDTPGLEAYWRFDEGLGETTLDLVGGREAEIFGARWRVSEACPPCDGDADRDLRVTLNDLAIVLQNFGLPEPDTRADVDDDGDVDMDDLNLLLMQFGLGCTVE